MPMKDVEALAFAT